MNPSTKQRFFISIVLLFVICILVFTMDYWESWIVGVISLTFSIFAIFIGVLIFMENRQPSKTITWLVVLAVNPILGFIFYMLFGQSYRKKRMFAKKAVQDEEAFDELSGHFDLNILTENEIPVQQHHIPEHQKQLHSLAKNLSRTAISYQTETEILTDGPETFRSIIQALKKAKHHIHMEYYIVRNDELGSEIQQILIDKVNQGVEVRFLYDAVGCWDLPDDYILDMRNAGVQVQPFSPVVFPLFSNRVNFRNHRKIIVIDSQIGFIGGLNIGDEYLGKDPYFGYWRDTHLLVRGEAVRTLQLIFLQDWFYMTDENVLSAEYLTIDTHQSVSDGGVQMVAGGPDHEWEVIKHLFFSMIVSAKRSIWIASPYFIPDEDILSALKVACLAGVDVRLLFPSIPDKRLVFYASRSYFTELMEAGMRIYVYKKGFMHSKVIIVDHELASIGSSNMDMRSFHLNFEVNCFLYGTKSIDKLVEDYKTDMDASYELKLDTFLQRPIRYRIAESLARLASPLL